MRRQYSIAARGACRQAPPGVAAHERPPDLISHRLDRRAFSDQIGQRIHGALTLPLLLNLLLKLLPV